MPQVTRCPHCQKSLQIPDDAAGKPIRCPLCKQVFRAVRAAEPAPLRTAPPATPSTVSVPPLASTTSVGRETMNRATPLPANGPALAPTECPACRAKLLPGATACLDCGYVVQGEGAAMDSEGAP